MLTHSSLSEPYFVGYNKESASKNRDTLTTKTLTDAEKEALRKYSIGGFRTLNHCLRCDAELSDTDKALYVDINSALNKLDSYIGKCYRGTGLSEEEFQPYLTAFERGLHIAERSFVSTSRTFNIAAENFTSNAFFEIQSKTGKSIARYSADSDEAEILFRSFTVFKVLKAIKKSYCKGFYIYAIWLEEL
jgi:hypothetical protein